MASAIVPPVDYGQFDWGEIIQGTKEQLQAFDLGVGLSFPGEPNGPRLRLHLHDARGYPVKIERSYVHPGSFRASISYPYLPPRWQRAAATAPFPDVRKVEEIGCDRYLGTGDALIAAGLVAADWLPGTPGMRKTRVTVLPDRRVADGPKNSNTPGRSDPGAMRIERASASTFVVSICVSKETEEARRRANDIVDSSWKHQARSFEKPCKLVMHNPEHMTRAARRAALAHEDVAFQRLMGVLTSGNA